MGGSRVAHVRAGVGTSRFPGPVGIAGFVLCPCGVHGNGTPFYAYDIYDEEYG